MFTKRNYIVGIIIFVAVWVLILVVPKTRALFSSQLRLSPGQSGNMRSPFTQDTDSLEALAKKYPDDAKVQTLLLQNVNETSKSKLPKYDALIHRFPNAIWLIQDRLRLSTANGFDAPAQSHAVDNDRYMKSQNWLTATENLQTLKIVRLGEKLDPQNTFYNWIEAMCWYGLHDNAKALDALQRGSRKPNYDDGALQDVRNRLDVQQLVMPVFIEDRLVAMSSEIFPHYAIMRNITRIALWQGGMQEKAGNHQRALKIYGAQMRLSSVMYKHTKMIIGKLVARAMLDMTWLSLTRKKPNDETVYTSHNKKDSNALFLTQAQRFADYAKSHGRADLANQAISVSKSIVNDPLSIDNYQSAYSLLMQSKLKPIGLLKWTGIELLNIISIGIIFWLFLFSLSSLLRKADQNKHAISIKPLGSVLCATITILCVAVGVALILHGITDKDDLYFSMFISRFVSNSEPYTMFNILTTWIPWVTFALIFICSFLPCCWKMRKSTFVEEQTASLHPNLATRISLLIGKVFLILLFIALQVIWVMWISNLNYMTRSPLIDFGLYATIPLPTIIFLILLWYWKRPQTPKMLFATPTFWLCCTTMLQQSLGLLVLVCTLSYGATSFASLPYRTQATTVFEKFLKVGEVKVLHEAIQQHPELNVVSK